jgi:hypothetical protein
MNRTDTTTAWGLRSFTLPNYCADVAISTTYELTQWSLSDVQEWT